MAPRLHLILDSFCRKITYLMRGNVHGWGPHPRNFITWCRNKSNWRSCFFFAVHTGKGGGAILMGQTSESSEVGHLWGRVTCGVCSVLSLTLTLLVLQLLHCREMWKCGWTHFWWNQEILYTLSSVWPPLLSKIPVSSSKISWILTQHR